MSYLSAISRLSMPNMGGLVVLQVARVADIRNIPTPVDGVIYSAIEFEQDKGFYSWYAADQTMSITSEDRDSQEGNYKSSQLPFFIAKDRPEIKAQLNRAQADEFIVLYKDANGKVKLFGTLEQPVIFEYSYNSDASRSGRNGYSCRFVYTGPDNINFYEADIASAPVGCAGVVYQWNGVTQGAAPSGATLNIVSEFNIDDFLVNFNES